MRQPPRAAHSEIRSGDTPYRSSQLLESDRIMWTGSALWFAGDDSMPAGPELDHADEAPFAPLQKQWLIGRVVHFDLAGQARHRGISARKPDSGEFADRAAPAVACHQVAAPQRRRTVRRVDDDVNAGCVLAEH